MASNGAWPKQTYLPLFQFILFVFIFMKAFDRMPRSAIERALKRQLVPEKLVTLMMALYEDARSSVSAARGTSTPFEITVGLHQGSALGPVWFNLVMEEAI